MNNKRTKTKAAILGGIAAISLLSPLAHADIIFFDDFTEDTTSSYTTGLSGTQNNLTYAPAGAPTNDLDWTSNYTIAQYQYQYGAGSIYNGGSAGLGYANGTTATNGSHTEVYLSPGGGNGHANSNVLSDLTTPILTSTGSAVNLVSGASYTLSLDVGSRTNQTMSTLGIDLFAGSTLLDPTVTIGSNSYTGEVTLSQLTTGAFTNFSFTIPSSALVSDSGALSIELVNISNQTQVNFSNIELSETSAVPEPGTWAMLLGGLGALLFFQRMRRGHKV